MSIYQTVTSLADKLALRCEIAQSVTESNLFSSKLCFKDRRSLVRRHIWEKLLSREKKNPIPTFDEYKGGASLFLEAYIDGSLPHQDFVKCFQVSCSLDGEDAHKAVHFLLLLRNCGQKADGPIDLKTAPKWRFGDESDMEKEDIRRIPLSNVNTTFDWTQIESVPPGIYYRSWESSERKELVTKPHCDAQYDYWHRSRTLMGMSCFSTVQPSVDEDFKNLSFHEFRSACIALLMGCPSQVFEFNKERAEYSLKAGIYVSGLSHDSLKSFSHVVVSVAECFHQTTKFLSDKSLDGALCTMKWYRLAVEKLFHRYLEQILSTPDDDDEDVESFVNLLRKFEQAFTCSVDLIKVWQLTKAARTLPLDNPWRLLGFLFKKSLRTSWQADNKAIDPSLALEQFLFAEVSNPLHGRLSTAVYCGISESLEIFGIQINRDQISQRNLTYWVNGYVLNPQVLKIEAPEYVPLMEAIISAGRSVEFLKICKPSHYLITLFNTGSVPILEFVSVNEAGPRRLYLAKHRKFLEIAEKFRQSSKQRYDEMKLTIVQIVIDKISAVWRQLKERDDVLKAKKVEQLRLKQEQKKELLELRLAETAAHRAAKASEREKERQADKEIARRLGEEDFTRTELDRRLLEEERKRMVEHYAELERLADWRRAKAEWRTQRLQLTGKRLDLIQSVRKIESWPFSDDEVKAERAPEVPRAVVELEPENKANVLPAKDEQGEIGKDEESHVQDLEINQTENSAETVIGESLPEAPISSSPTALDRLITGAHLPKGDPVEVGKDDDNDQEKSKLLTLDVEEVPMGDGDGFSIQESSEVVRKTPIIPIEEVEVQSKSPALVKIDEISAGKEVDEQESHVNLFNPDRPASLEVFNDHPTTMMSKMFVNLPVTLPEETKIEPDDGEEEDDGKALTFTKLFEKCLLQPAVGICEVTNFAVVEYLRDELDIIGHFAALRRYLLMDAGEFAIAISLPIFEALTCKNKLEYGTKKDPVSPYFLDTTLGNAVRYASSPLSMLLAEERSRAGHDEVFSLQQDFTKKLRFVKGQAEVDPSKPFCFDSLELTYSVGWPLNIVLPPEDLAIYSRVFSFLLEIGRVVNMLDSCLQLLEDCQQVAVRQSLIVDASTTLAALRRAHHARCLMRFFFTSIQTYLTSHVLRPQWEQLLREVNKSKSLDDLRKAHMTYLKSLEKRCFLTESTRPFRLILGRLIRCVLDFNAELNSLATCVLSEGNQVKKAQVAKIQAAANDFRANSAHFVSVAALRVSQYDRLGFLDRLLLQLTFNDFYSCETVLDSNVTIA